MFGKKNLRICVYELFIRFDLFFLENLVFEMSFISLEVYIIGCRLIFGIFLNSFLVKYEKSYFFLWNCFNL